MASMGFSPPFISLTTGKLCNSNTDKNEIHATTRYPPRRTKGNLVPQVPALGHPHAGAARCRQQLVFSYN